MASKNDHKSHKFRRLIAFFAIIFVFGFVLISHLIFDFKGFYQSRNKNIEMIIADNKFIISNKNIIALTKSRDGQIRDLAINLNWSPDPSETSSLETLFTAEKPFKPSLLLRLSEGEINPKDRYELLWKRYLKSSPFKGEAGLEGYVFNPQSPYDGEILFIDETNKAGFAARCLQATSTEQPEICLREIRIGEGKIDLLIKFPRGWLADWREIDMNVQKELSAYQK